MAVRAAPENGVWWRGGYLLDLDRDVNEMNGSGRGS